MSSPNPETSPPQNVSLRSVPPRAQADNGGAAGNVSALRSMPVDADVERALLSCLLKQPVQLIGKVIEEATPDYFYIPAHQIIFLTLVDLYNESAADIDIILLNSRLADQGNLDAVGGPAAVAELLDDVPTVALFDHYLEILRDKFTLRRVIQISTDNVTAAYDVPDDVTQLLDQVEADTFSIRDEVERKGTIRPMRDHIMDAIETIERSFENRGEPLGLSTGFKNVDHFLNGMNGGEMIVVAARPSMGKTSLGMNVVENVAIDARQPAPVAVFSLEMSAEQVTQRLLCGRAGVDMQKLRSGFLSQQNDFPKLMAAANEIGQATILIDDTPGLSVMELRAKARRLKKAHAIELIVIDYLQLLTSHSRKSQDNRQVEVAEISAGIKGLAKELDIPIVVLAQLNRNPDGRTDGRPRMSDLRESGSIEQDADVVALLVRESYYAADEEERAEVGGRAELIIAKQRNGPTGEAKLTFVKERMRFSDRAWDEDAPDDRNSDTDFS